MDRGIENIEALIRRVEESADPATRAGVRDLVKAVLEYHGAGIERLVEIAWESNPALLQEFARDRLVASLLLLYDLHPEDFATRVQRAVDSIPNIELAGIEERRVRVKLISPRAISREGLEDAIYAAAPETESIEIEGLAAAASFVPLEALLRA
jgi:hypothetical protein